MRTQANVIARPHGKGAPGLTGAMQRRNKSLRYNRLPGRDDRAAELASRSMKQARAPGATFPEARSAGPPRSRPQTRRARLTSEADAGGASARFFPSLTILAAVLVLITQRDADRFAVHPYAGGRGPAHEPT